MAFSYYRAITIDKDLVSGDQTNFPVLISGTYAYLATIANGGNVSSANGYDIAFYTTAAAATKLDHEIESYSATDGAVVFWVRIPSLSSSVDTVIYMFYGDSGMGARLDNPTGVWDSDFKGVWHLGDGTTLNVADTLGLNPTTNNGATATGGKLGGGAAFNALSQYITGSDMAINNIITVSAWVFPTTVDGNARGIIIKRNSSGVTAGSNEWNLVYSSSVFQFQAWNPSGTPILTINSATAPVASNWYHVVAVAAGNGNTGTIYINGSSDGTGGQTNTFLNTTNPVQFGAPTNNNASRYFGGTIDEVRISNVVRSGGWITTEYNNQSDPASFYSIDASATNALRTIKGIATITGVTSITF